VLARFTVLLMLGVILLLAAMVGYEMGSRMPWISPRLAGPIPWRSHASAFLLLGLPNVAILAAIGICIGLLSANRFVAWLVPIGMVALFPI